MVFAGLYLEAVDAGDDRRSKAWTPLFESRAATGRGPAAVRAGGHERPHQPRPGHRHGARLPPARAVADEPGGPARLPDHQRRAGRGARGGPPVAPRRDRAGARPGGVAGAHPGRLVERQPGPRCGLAAGTGALGAAVQPDPDPVLPAEPWRAASVWCRASCSSRWPDRAGYPVESPWGRWWGRWGSAAAAWRSRRHRRTRPAGGAAPRARGGSWPTRRWRRPTRGGPAAAGPAAAWTSRRGRCRGPAPTAR